MTKVISIRKDGKNIYSTEFKKHIIDMYEKLPSKNKRKTGVDKLASQHDLNPSMIVKWATAYKNRVGANQNSSISQSTTAFVQNGATYKPKKEQYEIIIIKIEKHLKEIQELKQKAIQLIKDM